MEIFGYFIVVMGVIALLILAPGNLGNVASEIRQSMLEADAVRREQEAHHGEVKENLNYQFTEKI